MNTICENCKKEIKVPDWKSKNFAGRPANKRFYCDYKCFDEFRSNGGLKRKKDDVKCNICGKIFYNRKRGKRINKYCSRRCWGQFIKEAFKKENNPNWNGGIDRKRHENERIRTSSKYRKWQKTVIKRDGKCLICKSQVRLEAHHIKSFNKFPDLIYELTNGITYCHSCHRKYHKLNGFQ